MISAVRWRYHGVVAYRLIHKTTDTVGWHPTVSALCDLLALRCLPVRWSMV